MTLETWSLPSLRIWTRDFKRISGHELMSKAVYLKTFHHPRRSNLAIWGVKIQKLEASGAGKGRDMIDFMVKTFTDLRRDSSDDSGWEDSTPCARKILSKWFCLFHTSNHLTNPYPAKHLGLSRVV